MCNNKTVDKRKDDSKTNHQKVGFDNYRTLRNRVKLFKAGFFYSTLVILNKC